MVPFLHVPLPNTNCAIMSLIFTGFVWLYRAGYLPPRVRRSDGVKRRVGQPMENLVPQAEE